MELKLKEAHFQLKAEKNEEVRKFTTGAVRGYIPGRGRMDLLPWCAILEVSKHCEAGAKKYGEHNVDKGIPVSSLMDSGMRHAAKFMIGQIDEDHLLAACWNFLWALEMVLTDNEMIDVPYYYKELEKEYGINGN